MADHTVENLREVEDMAPRFGMAPNVQARFATGALELERCGLSLQRLAPGFRMPFGHRHAEQEEVYVLVDGSAKLKIDDEVLELTRWDAVRVPPERMRCFEAGPDGAELLAFGAPRGGSSPANDAEMVPGWWSD